MRRDEFVKKCLAIGVSLPFASFLWSCKKTEVIAPNFNVNFKGKVVVIGAGSAGLTAGYLLERHGVEFQVLEASAQFGGRMKRLDNFVDFPIDLGAEWIHASPTILAQILSDPEANATVNFVNYTPQTIYTYNNGKLKKQNWANNFYGEYKFKDSTWFGFFEKYIAPKVIPHLSLDSPVTQIDYSGDKVLITTGNETIEADKVLITVPIKTLQDQLINFSPNLPSSYTNTFNNISM
ncbi:MAG: FAD-dependent oxidoreductase, partial [Schleiferiaceae bacterium]|nr:FAD-dependent oxidoreductase [Schleiferiaceae bacterium]